MTKKPAQNYSLEEFDKLLRLYSEGVSTAEIATILGRSERSIVAKLVVEGIYTVPERILRTKRLTKLDLIFEIAAALTLNRQDLGSLQSAKYDELKLLHEAITSRNKRPSLEDYQPTDFSTL